MKLNTLKTLLGKLIPLSILLITITSCSSPSKKFAKEPSDELIKKFSQYQDFSIILYDMNYEEGTKAYQHQYRILYEPVTSNDTILEEEITGWLTVSDEFFNKHKEDMGMEIISKVDGKLEKKTAPPGYSQYVGNQKYGNWQTNSSGGSFWSFYGKYAFMSSMFNMMSYPVRRSYYNDYRGNYYHSGRSYYGPTSGSRNMYGTNSAYNQTTRSSSTWNNKSDSFKRNVRSNVQRSASTSKRSRSSSRYQGSRSRSRSGGYGK